MIRRLIDMQAASEIIGPAAVLAYGTSEGVKKAWDTRGRRTGMTIDQHLREVGFRRAKVAETGENDRRYFMGKQLSPDEYAHFVSVKPDGSWQHSRSQTDPSHYSMTGYTGRRTVGQGKGADSLETHIKKYGQKVDEGTY